MADPAHRQATYADLQAVPPNLVAEILDGELVTHPRPAPPHVTAGGALQIELGGPFQKGRGGPGGWIFLPEPEIHLGPHVVVPDIAGWRRERMPIMPRTAYYETAPDFVCEILSPSTEADDRGRKRRIYAAYDVGYLWHLDPLVRVLEAFVLRDKQWVLFDTFQDGSEVTAPPFDEAPFSLANLWPIPSAPDQD
jgi:Uma2 family endonuclease